MERKRTLHVIGTGTIGEPLTGLLALQRERLGVDEVTFHKRTPLLTDRSKVTNLIRRGAKLCVDEDARQGFREIGIEPAYETHEALERASVVIDCTPSGVGQANKVKFYEKYADNTLGFIAQGSEFGFGKMYARGINDQALERGKEKFLQVVSCNTHNLAVLINRIAIADEGPDNLVEGRFLCIRRANDISQDGKFIPSPQVGSHKDDQFGTHHARDAHHLFRTLGFRLNLFSSALKVNTQYMHTVYFSIRVRKPTTRERVQEVLENDPLVAVTHKTSANKIFSFGRDYGHYGRILNQTVVCLPTLHVKDRNEVVGFCFTPQDGNSVLSSVAAATWFLDPDSYDDRLASLKDFVFEEV
jgi:glyceraldehyde-3-phosphate dehydrogenase (NAD(P))